MSTVPNTTPPTSNPGNAASNAGTGFFSPNGAAATFDFGAPNGVANASAGNVNPFHGIDLGTKPVHGIDPRTHVRNGAPPAGPFTVGANTRKRRAVAVTPAAGGGASSTSSSATTMGGLTLRELLAMPKEDRATAFLFDMRLSAQADRDEGARLREQLLADRRATEDRALGHQKATSDALQAMYGIDPDL